MKKRSGLSEYQLELLKLAEKNGELIRDDFSLDQTTIAHAPLRRDVLKKLADRGLLDRWVDPDHPKFSGIPPRETYKLTEKGVQLLKEIRKK